MGDNGQGQTQPLMTTSHLQLGDQLEEQLEGKLKDCDSNSCCPPTKQCLTVLCVVALVLALVGGQVFVSVAFYKTNNCTSNKSHECYCNHFDSWSCHINSSRSKYKDLDHVPPHLDSYYVYSLVSEGVILSLISTLSLVLRCRDWKCLTEGQSNERYIARSYSTSKELRLQMKITIGFLLGSFVNRLAQVILLSECSGLAIRRELRITTIVLRTAFTWMAAVFITFQVTIGGNNARFRMPFPLRCLCGLLGGSCAVIVVATLAEAACLNQPTNEEILSKDVWNLLKPLCYSMEVGLYGQFVTLFFHFAFESGQSEEGRPNDRGVEEMQSDYRKRGVLFVVGGACAIIITTAFTVTAIYLFLDKENLNITVVSGMQLGLHLFIIVFGLITLIWNNSTTRNICFTILEGCCDILKLCWNCCTQPIKTLVSLWKWLFCSSEPERLIYVIYFLGAAAFNVFAFSMYIKYGNRLKSKEQKKLGAAETCFGFISVFVQFLVVLILKLQHSHTDDHENGTENRRSHRFCYIVCLMSLLTVSASLAAVDALREERDPDEINLRKIPGFPGAGFDVLYPLVVDFRIHSLIMIMCILLKERKAKPSQGAESPGQHESMGNTNQQQIPQEPAAETPVGC